MADAEATPEPQPEASDESDAETVLTPFYTVSAGGDGLTNVRAGWQDADTGDVEAVAVNATVGVRQASAAVEFARQWHLDQLNRAIQGEDGEGDG